MSSKYVLAFNLLFFWVAVVPVGATEPSRWVFSTLGDFRQGDLRGVSLTSEGRIVSAPAFEEILDTEEAFIFSAVADGNGNAYFGTGSNGRIFRVPQGGQGAEWARLEEASVYALAVDSANRIYAGTAPDGKVYRLEGQGEARTFFDPGDKYIWDLAVDRQDNLYVATGPKGIVYRVTPQGQSSTFYETQTTHAVSLAWDLDGNLLVGTSPGARLYRVTPQGRGTVLYEASQEEMRAVTVDRYGQIYAAALSGAPTAGESASAGTGSGASSSREDSSATGETTIRTAGTQQGSRLELYRIDRENRVTLLYSSNEELAFDLLARDDGNLLVATGNRGRILSIDSRRFVTHLVQSREEQATRFLQIGGRILVGCSNLGKVYELRPDAAGEGLYKSKVMDARLLSDWGRIRWSVTNPSNPSVRMFTRTGNTESPDHTWSDWAGPYTESQGTRIESPKGRYLQWKVEFPAEARPAAVVTDGNAVDVVTIHYQQQNMAPRITALTVHPPGVAFMRFPAANPGGGVSVGGPDGAHLRSLPRAVRNLDRPPQAPPPRRVYIPGAQSFSWSAEDSNDDDLVYSIYYRRQDETRWQLLEKNLTETDYTMDGVSFSDGVYFVRVVASDLPSNTPSEALEAELISPAFVLSNSTPRVENATAQVEGNRVTVAFTALTGASTVYRAEYSLDAEEWRLLRPVDGIADSSEERYEFTLDNLGPGQYLVNIRVVDSVGSLGSGRVQFRIN